MASSRIVFALDLPSLDEARAMALAVRDAVGMLKVGLELFVEAGPRAAALGQETGLPVPDATLVTPGVRAAGDGTSGGQKRTMSAGDAIKAGASWVVVGRPIRDAADPLGAARAIAREVDVARGAG